jgi:hypothetical protein
MRLFASAAHAIANGRHLRGRLATSGVITKRTGGAALPFFPQNRKQPNKNEENK